MLRTMIVEDNIQFRGLVRGSLLSQYPQMEIVEVDSGEEALEKLTGHPPNLVFMDIHLPGENGLETTKKIRALGRDMTIIILTSHDWPEYREAALRYGANGFIGKDSLKWGEILTLVKCHQKERNTERKPTCVQLSR